MPNRMSKIGLINLVCSPQGPHPTLPPWSCKYVLLELDFFFLIENWFQRTHVKHNCSWQTLHFLHSKDADCHWRKITAMQKYTADLWNEWVCLNSTLHSWETGDRKKQQEEEETNRKQFLYSSQVQKPARCSGRQRSGSSTDMPSTQQEWPRARAATELCSQPGFKIALHCYTTEKVTKYQHITIFWSFC